MKMRSSALWTAVAVLLLVACGGANEDFPYDEPDTQTTPAAVPAPGASAAPGTAGPGGTLDTPGAAAPGTPPGAAPGDTVLPLDTTPGAPSPGAGRP